MTEVTFNLLNKITMWENLWNAIGKKLFANYSLLEDAKAKKDQELIDLKYAVKLENEKRTQYQQAFKYVVSRPEVMYCKFLPTTPETILVRENRGDKQIILYDMIASYNPALHRDCLHMIGWIDFTISKNGESIKIEMIKVNDDERRRGLGSILLKEVENLFPNARIRGTIVEQKSSNKDYPTEEELVKFYSKNNYVIEKNGDYYTFSKTMVTLAIS